MPVFPVLGEPLRWERTQLIRSSVFAEKRHGAPKNKYEKGNHFIKQIRFIGVLQFPIFVFVFEGHFLEKTIQLIAPEMVPWLSNKSEDQSGGPRTNLEVFGDGVSFQYFPKT